MPAVPVGLHRQPLSAFQGQLYLRGCRRKEPENNTALWPDLRAKGQLVVSLNYNVLFRHLRVLQGPPHRPGRIRRPLNLRSLVP